jgi:pyruvate/2-oxoglutarate dehydrogenase complex dihydrolipoamide acyltransferase (E2) component
MKRQKTGIFRKLAIYGFDLVKNSHNFYALLEFDITDLRTALRNKRIDGSGGSLFSFFLKAIGKCLEDFPAMNSMIDLRKFTTFEEVDVNIPIEIEDSSGKLTKQCIIRNINAKTLHQVDREIESARLNMNEEKGFVSANTLKLLNILPGFAVGLLFKFAMISHQRVKELSGTVFVTSVSMFSNLTGYILPYSGGPKAVSFAIGSSVKKPVVVKNEIVIREMINITAIFNHDSVDGAPAARFVNQLRSYIEKDYEKLF